ncbi:MAG TPA: hypothetical protein VKF79_03975 [Candidatus Acidoferrum sp.]|nr:hypothetical protein [Candidatus Acidoferrum sp.]
MKKSTKVILAATALFLVAFTLFGVERWTTSRASSPEEMLRLLVQDMPAETTGIVYVDMAQMRQSPFLQKMNSWTQKPQSDADYAQFVAETGFNFERDLDRVAMAGTQRGSQSVWFALADGSFDEKKIKAYMAKSGTVQKRSGYDIYTVVTPAHNVQTADSSMPPSPPAASKVTTTPQPPSKISLAFLRDGRLAVTNDADLSLYLDHKEPAGDAAPWQTRFTRLAGCPVFVVIRQDASTVKALAEKAPGGLQSPQLSSLMSQLTWLTLALRPEHDSLRIVTEGESPNATAAKQLSDMLNGLLLLARAGLGDPKLTQQMNPTTRTAFVGLLNSAEVSNVDREDLKAVRVVLEITPDFLNLANTSKAAAPASSATPQPSGEKPPR